MTQPKRMLFISNHGSLGDLHPFIAMGRALQAVGHEVTIAVSPMYVSNVERAGLRAVKAGPDFDPNDPAHMEPIVDALLDVRRGPLRLLRDHVFPSFERWIEDTLPLARDADLLFAGALGLFVPTVAELTGKPWTQTMIAPLLYWSAYDPPQLPQLPFLRSLRCMGPRGYALLYRLMFSVLQQTARPLYAARRARGLPRGPKLFHPEGRDSPFLNFAVFSKHFAAPQRDWPRPLVQTGFLRYDGAGSQQHLDADLERFLRAGPPPVLLTLGSGASVFRPGHIYDCFVEASRRIPGFRGVLLVGPHAVAELRPKYAHANLFVGGYAPFGELMGRCRALVHQGGIGTTGRALESGVPSLIIGHANDQLDNGRLVAASGAGLSIRLQELDAKRLANAIQRLSADPRLKAGAAAMSAKLRSEDPEGSVVRAIARFFEDPAPTRPVSNAALERFPFAGADHG